MTLQDKKFYNLIPPLVLLSLDKKKNLIERLKKLKFIINNNMAA